MGEVFDEQGDIGPPVAQGGHVQGEHVEPIEEVRAEGAVGDGGVQIAIGGGDHADVHADGRAPPDPLEFALLQHAEQHDLGLGGELGDLVVQAAQLALGVPGAPQLDVKDTGGTPQGAAAAAHAAITDSAGLIIGPLLSSETAAVAPIARGAGVPVLAKPASATALLAYEMVRDVIAESTRRLAGIRSVAEVQAPIEHRSLPVIVLWCRRRRWLPVGQSKSIADTFVQ